MPGRRDGSTLRLRAGEWVEVRSADEILATLDDDGRLDGLPFMPEMLAQCGRRYRVFKRADKVNDLVENTGLRRMRRAVILDGVRCDGSSHGGCQAGCQSLWKEAWLRRVAARSESPRETGNGEPSTPIPPKLAETTRRQPDDAVDGDERFVCQATEMKRASETLHPWDLRQYVRDVWSGNVGPLEALAAISVWLFNWVQRVRGGIEYPLIEGRLRKTPRGDLGLRPGDVVRVKRREEIAATLDGRQRNRGLWFDAEMVKYCGGTYRVLRRVERIIDEKSGRMIDLPNDCIVLDGVTCLGDYHRFYPQNEYLFWREAWLTRVEPVDEAE